MLADNLISLLEMRAVESPVEFWLRDCVGEEFNTWTYGEALQEIWAVGSWLEEEFGHGNNVAILSRNRAHWVLSDLAIMASGNVTIPLFTTMSPDVTQYVKDFTDTRVLFVGESINWEQVKHLFSEDITIVALPGVDPGTEHLRWEDLLRSYKGREPKHHIDPHGLATIVFTSGTTGKPKGVMQSQYSLAVPNARGRGIIEASRLFSYLPLAHIAERNLVEVSSLNLGASITFNESLETLNRDLTACRPQFFFGPPRVWEQMQQGVLAKFGGSHSDFDAVIKDGGEPIKQMVREGLGLDEANYMLCAAAPVAPALLEWYHKIGMTVTEGFGQTEVMQAIICTPSMFKIGSVGKPMAGVEVRITEEDELAVKADGVALGYYKNPEATAETFRDGWVYTGDKVRIDEDGFYYITGRVKDSFKTIRGKFVAPTPIEGAFGRIECCEQLCLLGRGYHKPVMVCVLAETAADTPREEVEEALRQQAATVNEGLEAHERIGAAIVSRDPWTIENGVLTHTMKIKRDQVEARFGEVAQELALQSAEQHQFLIHWAD
jgi:long-chain acyl-CoA synthetase